MRKILQFIFVAVLLFALGLFTPVWQVNAKSLTRDSDFFSTWRATPTSDGSYVHDFKADFYLTRDESGISRLRVVETIDATFPSADRTHGLVRVIPFTNQDGANLTMKSDREIELNAMRNGLPESVAKVESGDGFFKVYLGDADTYLHGTQTYTLEYEFEDVITEQTGELVQGISGWQELYWDVNGNDWGNSFDSVTAIVHIDQNIAREYLDLNACYVGIYGGSDSARCDVAQNEQGTTITFSAEEIDSYENLTFVLAFKPGTFTIPENPKDYKLVLLIGAITISGSMILVMIAKRYHKTKDKREFYKNQFVKPEYTPLADVTVAEMYANSIKSCRGNTYIATLMEVAVARKIIIHKTTKDGVFKSKNIWTIEIVSDDFLPEQRDVLKILNNAKDFKKGDKFELKRYGYDAMANLLLENYNNEVKKRLVDLGLFEDKAKVNAVKTGGVAIIIMVWEFIAILLLSIIGDGEPYRQLVGADFIFIVAATLVLVPIISIAMMIKIETYQKRTEKGLTAARYLEGLKLYVKMAESERIKFLQSVDGADVSHQGIVKLYEKLLPYAIIFGLEKSWIKEMGKYYEFDDVTTPAWYIGMGAFVASDFSDAISEMNSFAGSSISHSTASDSSSSGSGFSSGGSGGFSGGGGGGGGGGTW